MRRESVEGQEADQALSCRASRPAALSLASESSSGSADGQAVGPATQDAACGHRHHACSQQGSLAWIRRKGAVQCTASMACHCLSPILWIMPSHVNPAHGRGTAARCDASWRQVSARWASVARACRTFDGAGDEAAAAALSPRLSSKPATLVPHGPCARVGSVWAGQPRCGETPTLGSHECPHQARQASREGGWDSASLFPKPCAGSQPGTRHSRAPALFTRMSIPEKALTAASTSRTGRVGSVTSPGTLIAVPQLLVMKSTVACAAAASKSLTTTRAPW